MIGDILYQIRIGALVIICYPFSSNYALSSSANGNPSNCSVRESAPDSGCINSAQNPESIRPDGRLSRKIKTVKFPGISIRYLIIARPITFHRRVRAIENFPYPFVYGESIRNPIVGTLPECGVKRKFARVCRFKLIRLRPKRFRRE